MDRKSNELAVAKAKLKIAEYYGLSLQCMKLIEELGELIQALAKDMLNKTYKDIDDNKLSKEVLEEIADVRNLLSQVTFLSKSFDTIDEIEARKVDRQLLRIKGEDNKESLIVDSEGWNIIQKNPADEDDKEIYGDFEFIYSNLPEVGEEVLLYLKNGDFYLDKLCDEISGNSIGFYWEYLGDLDQVIAWKELKNPSI